MFAFVFLQYLSEVWNMAAARTVTAADRSAMDRALNIYQGNMPYYILLTIWYNGMFPGPDMPMQGGSPVFAVRNYWAIYQAVWLMNASLGE